VVTRSREAVAVKCRNLLRT